MKKIFLIFTFLNIIFASNSYAFCPVCTVAVGAGVGLSRWLGIDDTIAGLWIGGFTVSLIAWTLNWLKSKSKTFPYSAIIISFLYYAFIVIPLVWGDIIGHPLNKLWGIDKLFLGIVFGSFVFLAGGKLYEKVKANNGGHAHFPFEKIVFPIAPLIILSFVFWFITK